VTLSARTYSLGQNVHYAVRVHNLIATTCPGGARSVPALPGRSPLPALQLGPCSSLPLSIENARGEQVFPDAGGIACPMLIGPSLAPRATVRALGTWDRVEGILRPAHIPTPAPAGRYHLVIGGVSLPFTLTNDAPAAALTSHTTHGALASTARNGHVAFGGCPARSVTMTVTIAPNASADVVTARVTVHNGSDRWCGPHHRTGSLDVGPCGSVSAVVHDAQGVDVYPGNELYFCPEYIGPGVGPHASVSGIFRWTGAEDLAPPGAPARSQQAPPGRYSLDVAGVLKVPFTLPG